MTYRNVLVSLILLTVCASLSPAQEPASASAAWLDYTGGSHCSQCKALVAAKEDVAGRQITKNYDVVKYSLWIEPNFSGGSIDARTDIVIDRVSAVEEIFEFHFEGSWFALSTAVNGVDANHDYADGILRVYSPTDLGEEIRLVVSVEYSGVPGSNPAHGLRSFTVEPSHAWTFSQPYQARYWFPCYDLPDDKADEGVEQFITVPAGISVAANGRQQAVIPTGGKFLYHWRHVYPISSYLIAFSAAPYTILTDSWNGIPITYFLLPYNSTAAARYDLGRHPQMFEVFSELFGDYPFESYGVMFVNSGGWAMEHQTMTTSAGNLIIGNRLAESVFAHELAHHWWGDSITLNDYSEIWLNEGFASYSEILWAEAVRGPQGREDMVQYFEGVVRQDQQNRGPHSLYRDSDDLDLMFSPTIYKKGALVLHALRHEIGDEAFFKGLKAYHEAYKYDVADTGDFRAEMEKASGRDLSGFFQGWVYGTGWPELAINSFQIRQDGTLYQVITLSQVQENGTLFDVSIPVDPDGSGPLPVEKMRVNMKHTQHKIALEGSAPAPELLETSWVMYDPGQYEFAPPVVVHQSKSVLKKGRDNTVFIRIDGLTPLTMFMIDKKDVEILSVTQANGGESLKVRLRVPENLKRKYLGYRLINPDGRWVKMKKAFEIR